MAKELTSQLCKEFALASAMAIKQDALRNIEKGAGPNGTLTFGTNNGYDSIALYGLLGPSKEGKQIMEEMMQEVNSVRLGLTFKKKSKTEFSVTYFPTIDREYDMRYLISDLYNQIGEMNKNGKLDDIIETIESNLDDHIETLWKKDGCYCSGIGYSKTIEERCILGEVRVLKNGEGYKAEVMSVIGTIFPGFDKQINDCIGRFKTAYSDDVATVKVEPLGHAMAIYCSIDCANEEEIVGKVEFLKKRMGAIYKSSEMQQMFMFTQEIYEDYNIGD